MEGDVIIERAAWGLLPSPSPLTGNFRPTTAAAFVEDTLRRSGHHYSGGFGGARVGTPSGHGKAPAADDVVALRSAVSRHIDQLRKSTHPHFQVSAVQPQIPASSVLLPMGGPPAPRSVSTPPMRPAPMAPAASDPTTLPPLAVPTATEEGTEASAASPGAASPSGRSLHPVPAGQGAVRFATSSRQGSRPGTSPLSVQDLTLGRSGSRAGPRPPALDVGSPGGPGAGSGGGGGKPLTPTGFHASIGGRLSATGPTGPQPTRYASSPTGGRFHHTITASRAADGLVGGASAAAAEAQRMGNFRVSRGMVYSVFQDLDDFDTGRLTYSAFEQAACKVGMKPDQARRFFRYLDPQARGYTTMSDWGAPQLEKQMEAFTRLYVQNTRGPDGRPRGINEVRSAAMAVQMALTKLQLKRNGRSVSLERLVEAFRFIDRDASGALSPSEMEDALNSLGIFVTPEVVGSIMTAFDKDGSGGVDYLEFVRALFPMLGQTAHVVR